MQTTPNQFYNNPQSLEIDYQRIFHCGWFALCFQSVVGENNTAVPVKFMGQPYLVVRDSAGAVHIYANVCRHRGVELLIKPQRGGLITCPYHAWSYDLQGNLRKTPHIGGENCHELAGFDINNIKLNKIRHVQWFGVIFINPDGNAPEFADYAGRLMQRWNDFQDIPFYYAPQDSQLTLNLQTNWKFVVENYCEAYHLPIIHPALNSYSKLIDHENLIIAGLGSGQISHHYAPGGASFPSLDNFKNPFFTRGAEYISFFPNVLLGVHRDHAFAIIITPLAHNQSREELQIYYFTQNAVGDDFRTKREQNLALWKQVFEEDIDMVESMQNGRSSPFFDGGILTPLMDASTQSFHHWLMQRLG